MWGNKITIDVYDGTVQSLHVNTTQNNLYVGTERVKNLNLSRIGVGNHESFLNILSFIFSHNSKCLDLVVVYSFDTSVLLIMYYSYWNFKELLFEL